MTMFGMQIICVVLTLSINVIARLKSKDDFTPKTSAYTYPERIVGYLKTYGYITESDSNKSESLSQAISRFQSFMGIFPSGRLDKMTKELMKHPRCGELDIYPNGRRQESLIKALMKRKVLRYNIKNWTNWISKTLQNQTVYNMLRLWTDDLQIKCHWSTKVSDVDIIFKPDEKKGRKYSSYDVYTKVNFVNSRFQVQFYSNAAQSLSALSKASAHAFGHIFGHDHSNLYGLMSPIFRQTGTILSDRCQIPIDAAFLVPHNATTYFMSGPLVWEIHTNYTFPKPPSRAVEMWKGLPPRIDDGFAWAHNWETYFFKGSQYYRYNTETGRVDDGYPYPIADGWPGIPNDIDAVFSNVDGKTYFFKGKKAYLYEDEKTRLHPDFPKAINDVFPGVPDNIDSAIRYYYDNTIYFFQGLYYWTWSSTNTKASGPFIINWDWHNLCKVDY